MMERLKASHVKKLPELFSKVDEFLTKTLYTKDTITPALIEKVEAGLTEIYKEFGEDFKGSMVDVFIDSYKFEHESVAAAYGATAGNLTAATAEAILVTKTLADVPSDNKLRKVYQDYIDSKPLLMDGLRGKHFAKVIDDFSQAEAELVSNTLRAGHFEGKTVQELKQQIRGTRKNGFRDGILQASSRHAEAIVRTGLQQAACDAREEFAQANDDIIEGVQILATLDSRTCLVAGTLIDTPFGKKAIEDFKEGDKIIGGSGEVREVKATLLSKAKKLCKVKLSNGSEIVCTQDHRWWDGVKWVEAQYLKVGDELPNKL